MDLPLLHDPESGAVMSYVQALDTLRAPEPLTHAATPVEVLMRGLDGPATTALQARRQVPVEVIGPDLRALLRTPALRFYFAVSDCDLFISAAQAIVAREGFEERGFQPLPMVSAVGSVVSYDLLREVVKLDLVATYQEEGTITTMPLAGEAIS